MMSAEMQPSEARLSAGEVWADPLGRLERRTAKVEEAVAAAYQQHLAPHAPGGVALLAVGGFGRRELCPHSDIDLLFLTAASTVPESIRSALSDFLRALWDSGLRISHSVRTTSDCTELNEQNIELTISLLDERFLAGDRGLHAGLGARLPRFVHGQRQALARHLCRLARERHAKNGGSIYELEPDVKESPGGLRDLHLLYWLGRLRESQADFLPRPAADASLLPAREFLIATRSFLHLRAGRDSNRLLFEAQDEIAEQLGAGPAEWMRILYSHARDVSRAAMREIEAIEEQSSHLLVQFREWRSRVSNSEFHVLRERVFMRMPQRMEQEPELALRLFQFVGRHGFRLSQETVRRLAYFLPVLKTAFARPATPLWTELRGILAQPHTTMALRAMQETGVLPALFPEWAGVECLVIRDFYHRYTVDEHTLRAIGNLEALRSPSDPALRPFADLLAEIDDPELLNFALLFHDLGKAFPGPHVAGSIRLAEAAMDRIGMPKEQRAVVRTLIESHLDLSKVMRSRDLEDPATGRDLAARAGTLEALKKLTLLTYADISAVNPSAMTGWRRRQLWQVYLLAYNQLTRELDSDRIQPGASSFLEGFPVRYLRTHSENELAAHYELARRSTESGVAIDVQKSDGYYRLAIVTRDRPALLAAIAGALAGFGMNILKAEGFANREGLMLDTFVFTDPHRTLELNPTEMDRLRGTLERVTLGKLDVKEMLRRRPVPPAPSKRARIKPSVSFDGHASESATLIQVVAQDRPGLLFSLASAISSTGANIQLVLIETEAHKAIDAFYVTSKGGKLTEAEQAVLKERLLAAG